MKEHLTSGLLDTLLHFVRWVDTWKKLLILFLLAIIFTTGILAWEYRSRLVEPVLRVTTTPGINEDNLEPEMSAIIHDTGAVAVAVWSVSMERNYREAIYVRINDKQMNNLEGAGDIVLRLRTRETTDIIRLLDTSAACWPYKGVTAIGMEAIRAGVKWVCATTIPPHYGAVAGILAVGFAGQPGNEEFIKTRLINAAEKVMN
ncbi:hypothetical protein [Yokenella regensburgei]|uniref:hypothetical protein n=1 Tax=Yokenella regensburgei TaxID=158877 RepID=UPI003ED8A7D8